MELKTTRKNIGVFPGISRLQQNLQRVVAAAAPENVFIPLGTSIKDWRWTFGDGVDISIDQLNDITSLKRIISVLGKEVAKLQDERIRFKIPMTATAEVRKPKYVPPPRAKEELTVGQGRLREQIAALAADYKEKYGALTLLR